MMKSIDKPLINPSDLLGLYQNPSLVVLDASFENNPSGKVSDYLSLQLPQARYFDIKKQFSDANSPYPNTLPSPEKFAEACQKLGINQDSEIVVYDNIGIYTSPRAWWMFKTMGHEKVAVLNGGLPEWIQQGYDAEERNLTYEGSPGDFHAIFRPKLFRDYQQVKGNVSEGRELLIDARSSGRFNGTAPEPREGLRSGSIPNSKNLPFQEVLEEGKYKEASELEAVFDQLGVGDSPLVFSCGSGVTACILMLAAAMSMPNSTAVYDGSWTEWGLKEPQMDSSI